MDDDNKLPTIEWMANEVIPDLSQIAADRHVTTADCVPSQAAMPNV